MNAHPDSATFTDASPMALVSKAIPFSDRVILALDVPTVEEARSIVREVSGLVSFFKIGLQLQYSGKGAIDFAAELSRQNKKVFLDSKIFDIGNTIQKTVENIARLEIDFLTVHGDRKVIESAAQADRGTRLKILAVTVLTSLDHEDLRDMGLTDSVDQYVKRRARLAIKAGADGVISAGLEAEMIRDLAVECGATALKIVTPGIRPIGTAVNDQKRVATPRAAIEAGADHLVVGRPVLNAESKIAALEAIFSEVQEGLASRN